MVILDRDGVINIDSKGFIKSPEEWLAIPGSLEAIAQLNHAGFIVCVATNQSGVGRKLFSLETLHAMHEKMRLQLHALGGHVDDIIYCSHLPEDLCACRKPKPGMIATLLKKWQVLAENTWVIGDALRDLEAGQAMGCKTILVKTGKGEQTVAQLSELSTQPLCFTDLNHAVQYLLSADAYVK